MGGVGIGAGVAIGRAVCGLAGAIAAVAIRAAPAAGATAMSGLIGAGAAVTVGEAAAAMAGAIGGIVVGDLGFGSAGAEDGQSRASDNGAAGDPANE
jgi:hypothetical protein